MIHKRCRRWLAGVLLLASTSLFAFHLGEEKHCFGLATVGHDSRTEPFRIEQYQDMEDDHARTSAYYQAIDRLTPGKIVLDLGTGALALLALRCAKAGARKVYAVEEEPEAAELARLAVEAQGLSEQITVLVGKSEEIELPEKVDLVVHEIVGEIASREGMARAMRDARARHVVSHASHWSIPRRVTTWIAPSELAPNSYFESQTEFKSYCLLEATSVHMESMGEGFSQAMVVRLPEYPIAETALASPQTLEDFSFLPGVQGTDESLQSQLRKQTFIIQRPGRLESLSMYVTVHCGGGAPPFGSVSPGSHWSNCVLMLDAPADVEAGDVLHLETRVFLQDKEPTYFIKASTQANEASESVVLLDAEFN